MAIRAELWPSSFSSSSPPRASPGVIGVDAVVGTGRGAPLPSYDPFVLHPLASIPFFTASLTLQFSIIMLNY